MLDSQVPSLGRRFSMCLSDTFATFDTTFVRDNSSIVALILCYVAIVMSVMEFSTTGHDFLHIYWFDPITLSLGALFSLGSIVAQYFFPKLHHPFRCKNYIQLFIIILLLPPYKSAFASFKQFISATIPYRWDVSFMHLDDFLHFGHTPWRLLAYFIHNNTILYTIDIVYLLWFIMLIVFSLWMGVSTLSGLRKRYFITAILIWSAFGSGLGSIFYSVGPCYYASVTGDPGPYKPLLHQLEQAHEENILFAVKNERALWQAHIEREWLPFGGISAMPSVHVAMAVLFALTLGEAYPLLRLTGWIFALLIQIGSVILAWHYAVDGYASALLTLGVWRLLRRVESQQPAGLSPVRTPSDGNSKTS